MVKKQQTFAVPVERLTWEGVDIPVSLGPEWFERWLQDEPGLEFSLATPITGLVHLERHDGNILLHGHLEGALRCTCSRCLDSFDQPVAADFDLLIKIGEMPPREEELALSVADLDEEYCAAETLDLEPILREQILLALPLKPLCQENCLGLCRRCGANLNREQCSCQAEAPASPLAALAKWKKD